MTIPVSDRHVAHVGSYDAQAPGRPGQSRERYRRARRCFNKAKSRMEATMQTGTVQDQTQAGHSSHSLIASDRVEGTPVRRSNGEKIGTIKRLMIDKLSGSVAYAVLNFG